VKVLGKNVSLVNPDNKGVMEMKEVNIRENAKFTPANKKNAQKDNLLYAKVNTNKFGVHNDDAQTEELPVLNTNYESGRIIPTSEDVKVNTKYDTKITNKVFAKGTSKLNGVVDLNTSQDGFKTAARKADDENS